MIEMDGPIVFEEGIAVTHSTVVSGHTIYALADVSAVEVEAPAWYSWRLVVSGLICLGWYGAVFAMLLGVARPFKPMSFAVVGTLLTLRAARPPVTLKLVLSTGRTTAIGRGARASMLRVKRAIDIMRIA